MQNTENSIEQAVVHRNPINEQLVEELVQDNIFPEHPYSIDIPPATYYVMAAEEQNEQ